LALATRQHRLPKGMTLLAALLTCLAHGMAASQSSSALQPSEAPLSADGAPPLPSALVADDECGAFSAGHGSALCSLSALQRRSRSDGSTHRAAGVSGREARQNSCMDFGCSGYVPKQACQCNPECRAHGNCCSDATEVCAYTHRHGDSDEHGRIMTLYHQTSAEIGQLILKGGFKPGKMGYCGGAIYFATSPQATITKARSVYSHQGFMIEAVVRLGRVKRMGPLCDMSMTGEKLHQQGFDTIAFNPIDGDEYVVYNSSQIVSTRQFPWKWHL